MTALIIFGLLLLIALVAAILGYWVVAAVVLAFILGAGWILWMVQDAIRVGAIVIPDVPYGDPFNQMKGGQVPEDLGDIKKLYGGSE